VIGNRLDGTRRSVKIQVALVAAGIHRDQRLQQAPGFFGFRGNPGLVHGLEQLIGICRPVGHRVTNARH
jgi:hypothetical protein